MSQLGQGSTSRLLSHEHCALLFCNLASCRDFTTQFNSLAVLVNGPALAAFKMLDPLSAISLAGSIAQFVDFSGKIISNTREMINSSHGMTHQAYNAEIVIQDLLRLSQQLKDGARAAGAVPQADDDKALEKLCNGCIGLSERMMKRLETLKLAEGASKRRALIHALKSALSQKELKSEEAQLATYRSQLEIRVLASFR